GGWTDSAYFSLVARDPYKRQAFASNVLAFITNNGFDGVDLDWECGGDPSNAVDPNDAENFLELLKSLRNRLGNRLITMAASANPGTYKNLLPQYAQILNWINVMTYDMCGGWSGEL
ncbi:glycoside hydrolase family 18 protein, partial [Gonapodya prolifera JEL478]